MIKLIKNVKILYQKNCPTNILVGVGARLAPAYSRSSLVLSFSARLFGPLAFSGFGHRGSPVLTVNLGNSKNRWERG